MGYLFQRISDRITLNLNQMDWQHIIVYLVIAIAAVITIRRLILFFRMPLNHCSGCAHATGDCSLAQLKREIKSH